MYPFAASPCAVPSFTAARSTSPVESCGTPYTGREPGEKCEKCGVGTLVRRKDDEPEAIKNRLVVFQKQTAPVLAWYRSHEDHGARVVHIDAVGPMDEITKRMLKQIGR